MKDLRGVDLSEGQQVIVLKPARGTINITEGDVRGFTKEKVYVRIMLEWTRNLPEGPEYRVILKRPDYLVIK